MQTSTKLKLARVGVLVLIRHRSARVVAGKVGGIVVRRKLRAVQASSPLLPDPPPTRRYGLIVAVAGGGAVVAITVLRRRSTGAVSTPSVPVSSPVVAPEEFAAVAASEAPAPTPVDTPPSSDSAPGEPPVPAAAGAADVGEGDEALAARVQSALFGSETPLAIEVAANAGVVTLKGPITDLDAATQLVKDAEQVDGVRAVQSELQIAPS